MPPHKHVGPKGCALMQHKQSAEAKVGYFVPKYSIDMAKRAHGDSHNVGVKDGWALCYFFVFSSVMIYYEYMV